MALKKEITFFYTDGNEKQTTGTVFEEAKSRGYSVKSTSDILEEAEIGFYCQHQCYPENSKCSVIMLHDMAQGHNRWPDFWRNEPWNIYDIGILPGPSWMERWNTCRNLPYALPRLGIYACGWPKADLIFKDQREFKMKVEDLRKSLGLSYDRSVLYAPSWENDNKQDDVVQALKDLPINILLKQAPYVSDSKLGWVSIYPQVVKDIERMNTLHRGCAPNVHIIDPDLSIMYCLGLADILVSDESSVMVEALLLDIPSLGVKDWLIPDQYPPRFSDIPFDFALKISKKEIRSSVQEVLDSLSFHHERLARYRNSHFVNLGNASVAIMDTIDSIVNTWIDKPEPVIPKELTINLFVHTILKYCETRKFNEAISFFNEHRKEFPDSEELCMVDRIMQNFHERIRTGKS